MIDKRYRIGIWVTGLYLLTLAIYTYVQRHAVLAMEPNEMGDALAGAASPLAFLWLVLGYLQQGEELRQNTEALNLQVKELQASVEQQKALVEATQRQHEFELSRDKQQRRTAFHANQPIFRVEMRIRDSADVSENWTFHIENTGSRCTDVALHSKCFSVEDDDIDSLDRGDAHWWLVSIPLKESAEVAELTISYVDNNGEGQSQRVVLFVNSGGPGDPGRVHVEPPQMIYPWERSDSVLNAAT